jgi:predicted secreted protein/putative sterol carrier protein
MNTQGNALHLLAAMLEKANANDLTPIRLQGWRKSIAWQIDGSAYYWVSDGSRFQASAPVQADLVLKCSEATLRQVAEGFLPFFIAIWGTGAITFEGSFADAYRLGYVFLSDKRARKIIFISHCWLNINTRFPEGCAFEGANVPLIKFLLDSGLGIIQMPCPEYECLGLEKWQYGELKGNNLRACFRKRAQSVVDQIKDYRAMGFEIVGVLGMNPSPSCGVGVAKGKGTLLGTSRDTSEQPESGLFIEEMQQLLAAESIQDIRFFAIRRTLVGETDLDSKIETLKSLINVREN